jgi:tetratricopeptide (TPR) repeat protein
MLAQAYDPFIEAQEQSEESETARRLCENLMGMMIAPDWKQRLKQARQQLTSEGGVPAPLVEVLMASESNAIVESLTRIQKLAQQGKQRAAMEEAFYALGIAPTYLPLHILMGELLLQQSEFQGAVDKFSIVARSYNTRGDTRRAISIYRRVIDLSPMDMAARNQLIALMVSGGQQEEAILEYNRLADLYYSLADLDNVSTTLSQALQLTQQPGISKASKVRIYSRIADVETQRLDWRKALRMYEQVRTLQPDDEKTRGTLIYINFRLGQDSQAVAEINNYVKLLLERNQPEKITSFLEDLAEEYPEHPGILRQLGDFYRQSGRTQDAIQKLDMAGELFLDAGQREAAIETIMAILAMNPPNASNYQQLLLQLRGG